MFDSHDGGDCEPRLQIRQPWGPGGRHFIRNHYEGARDVLRMVPCVEQLLFVALVGVIEQPPADSLDEAAREQTPARTPWTGEDGRLDRPHAEAAEVLERLAVRVRNDESGIAVALRPVERERDLVGGLLHGSVFGACAGGCGVAAEGTGTGGGAGMGGGLSPFAR